jgi:hypothetical protein
VTRAAPVTAADSEERLFDLNELKDKIAVLASAYGNFP